MWSKTLACFVVFTVTALAQEPAPGRPILILTAQVNSDNTLSINGQNFGTGNPVVNIDGTMLTVVKSSNVEIIAQLSFELVAGDHVLVVSPDSESAKFAWFNLRIAPVEADGPQDVPNPRDVRTAGLRGLSVHKKT